MDINGTQFIWTKLVIGTNGHRVDSYFLHLTMHVPKLTLPYVVQLTLCPDNSLFRLTACSFDYPPIVLSGNISVTVLKRVLIYWLKIMLLFVVSHLFFLLLLIERFLLFVFHLLTQPHAAFCNLTQPGATSRNHTQPSATSNGPSQP